MSVAFLTGLGGQDGSYLSERLLAEGWEVHALVRDEDSPAAYAPDAVVQHIGDVTRIHEVRDLLLDLAPRAVFNLAALSSVGESWSEPETTMSVNGLAAVGLLESAWQVQERHGVEVSFVQASSAEIFGSPSGSPQDESTPLAPVNPYGAAKALAHLAVGVWRGRGLRASSLVLYNHESPRRGRQFVTRKITSTVAAIARGEADELVLGNLDARRDWGWAPDYVDAMVRAAGADVASDYVVATGQGHSVRDFVEAAFSAVGITDWEGRVRSDPEFFRPVDAVSLVGDSSRIRERLGWAPTVGFEEIVARMVAADLG